MKWTDKIQALLSALGMDFSKRKGGVSEAEKIAFSRALRRKGFRAKRGLGGKMMRHADHHAHRRHVETNLLPCVVGGKASEHERPSKLERRIQRQKTT